MSLPAGYEGVDIGPVHAFAVREAVTWLREVLASGETLGSWASARASGTALAGRGAVFSVPAPVAGPEGRPRWVARHYYRGGAVAAPLLGDRYLALGHPRPLQELVASHNARARGIPTPAVVAGAIYDAGIWYRADLVTEQIPDGTDLAEVLFGQNEAKIDPAAALSATGALVRRLERTGILHPDLNAKNVVLARDGAEVRAHLVDLDGCRARAPGVPAPAFTMRQRLERSLRKFGRRTHRPLSEESWTRLRSALADKSGGSV